MKYKAILFDMNGVLVDDEDIQEEAFRTALANIGVALTADDFTKYFIGKTDAKGIYDYFAVNKITDDQLVILGLKHDAYKDLITGSIKGYAGVNEFIDRALERGLEIAIVTSTARDEAESNLSSLQLLNYFNKIVTGDDVTNGKPDPEGYLKGASLVAVKPAECIVIEDAPSGLAAAKAAGMFSVGVSNTHPAEMLTDASRIVNELSANLLDELIN